MLFTKRNKFLTIGLAIVLVFAMLLSGCQVQPATPSGSEPTSPSTPAVVDKTKIELNPAELV